MNVIQNVHWQIWKYSQEDKILLQSDDLLFALSLICLGWLFVINYILLWQDIVTLTAICVELEIYSNILGYVYIRWVIYL